MVRVVVWRSRFGLLGLRWKHMGCGSKLNHQGTAGFSPCFLLPGFHFGYHFLTHSHINGLAVGFR